MGKYIYINDNVEEFLDSLRTGGRSYSKVIEEMINEMVKIYAEKEEVV